jgi:NADH-ubiquinone oxidoreductase chain 1
LPVKGLEASMSYIIEKLSPLLEVIVVLIPILIGVAYVTIAERKGMGSMQRRVGPNAVGIWGLLQPFADALKLIVKENIVPVYANSFLFYLGPVITLLFALLGWAIIPFGPGITLSDFSIGVIYSLAISSLSGYGILIAGWAANSKYAFMGSLRSTAQIISYELILSSTILIVVLLTGSLNFTRIVCLQEANPFILPLLPISLIFFISALAETNRAPMDLAEAESELTAGFFTEHSSTIFVFFFLAEYANIILISTLGTLFFLGGYHLPIFASFLVSLLPFSNEIIVQNLLYGLVLGLKVTFLIFLFVWVRASFPRIRYDQLMTTCWTVILPIIFGFIFLIPCILYAFDLFPSQEIF